MMPGISNTAPIPARPWAPGTERGAGLYIHIPFCETKCPYCDFNTYSGIEAIVPEYMAALRLEIERWGGLLGPVRMKTLFFGGGTPSYVPQAEIAAVIGGCRAAFAVDRDAEVTLEANPGDVTVEKLTAWLASGVNRLSIGVQSFDDGLLKLLGRRHTADEAEGAARKARAAGFSNVNLDLMFGLPRQSLEQWTASLEHALSLQPEHLSLYGLQLERGTPLEAAVRTGTMPEPDQDLGADMYLAAEDALWRAGYRRYEISNWSRPDLESRHNLMYWRCEPYLGVGPGAHSWLFGWRFANMKSPRAYMAAARKAARTLKTASGSGAIAEMSSNGPVDFIEEATEAVARAEFMMMGLRLDAGISGPAFAERFGATLESAFPGVIPGLVDAGLIEWDGPGIHLTGRGRLLGNEVFRRFVETAGTAPLPGGGAGGTR